MQRVPNLDMSRAFEGKLFLGLEDFCSLETKFVEHLAGRHQVMKIDCVGDIGVLIC